jgi:Tol biopolymer transport system component
MRPAWRWLGAGLMAVHVAGCVTAASPTPTRVVPATETLAAPAPTVTRAQITATSPRGGEALSGRFAFDARGSIWVMNADGSGARQLTHGGIDFDPSWSPDGTRLVFRTNRGHYGPDPQGVGTEGIFIVNTDGSGEHQLYPPDANTPGGLFPDWSPVDNTIVLSIVRGDGKEVLALLQADGTGLTDFGVMGEAAAWSPDGQNTLYDAHPGDGNWQLWVMKRDGTQQTQLTDTRARRPGGQGGNQGGVWSPDGTQIAFASDRDGDLEVYVMNADGSQQRRLFTRPGQQAPEAWLPDGRIIFSDWSAGRDLPDWYVMQADGSGIAAMPALQAAGAGAPLDWKQ